MSDNHGISIYVLHEIHSSVEKTIKKKRKMTLWFPFFHRRISIFKRKGAAAPHNLCYRSFIVCLTTHISNLLNSYYFHRESNFFPSCIYGIICNGSRTNIVSIFIHPTCEPITFSRYSWNKICFFTISI